MPDTTTKIEKIPVCQPVLDGAERKYVLDCLDTGWVSSMGVYIERFEERFAAYCDCANGVSCSNGTAAVHLALASLGIGPGDEVIIPTFTLIVSANTVIMCGARPVLVDVDPHTWCLDPKLIENKITPRTKAIMAVHMYGHPCNMDAISRIAERHGLHVIEDAAQAHGAEVNGVKVGSLGDVAAFSFYGNKNLTTGEGGMLTTNHDHVAERARLLRNQAFEPDRFVHRAIGFNYRLANIQAAIGLAQCETAEQKIARKIELADNYTSLLGDEPSLQLPVCEPWAKNVYWMYGVVITEAFGRSRDEVMARLAEEGIDTRKFFHPMHRQPVFVDGNDPRYPDVQGSYPVSEYLGRAGLYLPSGLGLTDQQQQRVAETLLGLRA